MPSGGYAAYMVIRGRAAGPFFRFASGSPLSSVQFVRRVREALKPYGVDMSKYSGHSFRIGAATTAASVGKIPSSRHWEGGRAQHISYLLECLVTGWPQCQRGFQ